MNKKITKRGLYFARDPHGCDVARKATWQRHADPRSAYVAHYTYSIYFIIIYIKWVFSLPYMGRVINSLNRRVL